MHWFVDEKQANKIAKLNDKYRLSTKETMFTPGICSFRDVPGVIEEVKHFSNFNEDNDPWCEHDFGGFTWEGKKVFWKIDYYDSQLRHWKDPLSRECRRVLTIMLADEY